MVTSHIDEGAVRNRFAEIFGDQPDHPLLVQHLEELRNGRDPHSILADLDEARAHRASKD